jgi:hypothetical protein
MAEAKTMAPPAPPAPAREPVTVAEINDPVLWYQEGDPHTDPFPALVTGVGFGGKVLKLAILEPGLKNFRVADGVHHISDPSCRRIETRDSGGWSHTPRTLKLLQLLEALPCP